MTSHWWQCHTDLWLVISPVKHIPQNPLLLLAKTHLNRLSFCVADFWWQLAAKTSAVVWLQFVNVYYSYTSFLSRTSISLFLPLSECDGDPRLGMLWQPQHLSFSIFCCSDCLFQTCDLHAVSCISFPCWFTFHSLYVFLPTLKATSLLILNWYDFFTMRPICIARYMPWPVSIFHKSGVLSKQQLTRFQLTEESAARSLAELLVSICCSCMRYRGSWQCMHVSIFIVTLHFWFVLLQLLSLV